MENIDSVLPFLVILLPFLFMGGVVVLIIILVKKRNAELRERARQMQAASVTQLGWPYAAESPLEFFSGHEQFETFSTGHSKEIRNLIHGEREGTRVAVFDFDYTVGHGKSRTTYSQTILVLESEKLGLPFFSMRPENFLHRIAGAFGYQDIDFAQRPGFSGFYLLRGQNELHIREAFAERVLAYYEQNPGLSTDGGGQRLLCYRQNSKVPPEQLRQFVEWGLGLAKLFQRTY
ncbi:MAG: hypothetical protein ACRD9R_17595 [Pyrinomonadaceae bacterium]